VNRRWWLGVLAVFALLGIGAISYSQFGSPDTSVQMTLNLPADNRLAPTLPTNPTPSPTTPGIDTTAICGHRVGSVRIYFANDKHKESSWAVGPPILGGTIRNTPSETRKAITESWRRLCVDPKLTATVAAGFDHHLNPYANLTDAQWVQMLQFIWSAGDWRHARLIYMDPRVKWADPWTDYMQPGKAAKDPPRVGYLRYPDGPAWFLDIRNLLTGGDVYPRQACGDQITAPRSELPATVL
jgi:hypothetical protein